MRMYYSLPQSKTLRVFGGVGSRGSGMEGENPRVAAADGGLGTAEVADSKVWLMARA